MKEQERLDIGQQGLQIKSHILSTSFGQIHLRAVGAPGKPLIIAVHGFGANPTSDQYQYLLHQYYVRISYISQFYVVAIDCPGFGTSEGSKQAIKLFPTKMFDQILEKLNYKYYYAMIGHQQAAATILNVVLKSPKITRFIVMDRPIIANVQKFIGISLPTLLFHDIDDESKPIGLGNILFKLLKNAQMYTYRSTTHKYWVQNQIWFKMLHFFQKDFRIESRYQYEIGQQNIIKETEQRIKVNNQFQNKREKSYSLGKAVQKTTKQNIQKSLQMQLIGKPIQLQNRLRVQKFHSFTNGKNRPNSTKHMDSKQQSFFAQSPVIEKKQIRPKQVLNQDLKDQYKCAICYQTLFKPIVTNCKHRFCSKCMMESFLVSEKCPLCRAKITKKTQSKQLHQQLMRYMPSIDIFRREKQLKKVQAMVKSVVYIEIGNTSELINTKKSMFTKIKRKYNWQFYVKQPKNFQIEQVELNINLDDQSCKPIKMRNKPFTFESRSTYSFNCEVTIRPKNKEYPDIVQIYLIDAYPGTHSKIISLKKKCYSK